MMKRLLLPLGLVLALGAFTACSETTTTDDDGTSSSGGSSGASGSSGETSSGGSSSGGKSSSSGGGSSGGSSGASSSGGSGSGVVINEVAPSDDFVELYNVGDDEIDLSGYVLVDYDDETDGPKPTDDEAAFTFPEGTVLEAGAFLVVKAAEDAASTEPVPCFEDDEQGPGTCFAALFRLSKDEPDAVFLIAPGGETERVDLPASPDPDAGAAAIEDDQSYARTPNGTGDFAIVDERTPGRANP